MNDLEVRLRDAMHTAVPDRFDTSELVSGVQRHAARTRRLRRAGGAVVAAVVIAVAGASASGMLGNRAVEPAVPSPTTTAPNNLCPDLQAGDSPLTAAPSSPVSSHADSVLVCALTGADSVWPGSLPPDEAVTRPQAIDLLDWRPKDDEAAAQCGDRPHGRAFTVSYRDLQGTAHTYANSDLLCDGWVFLDSYYVALSEQAADYSAHQPAQDDYPSCPSILPGLGDAKDGTPSALPRGTVLKTASVCAHPAVDPLAVTADHTPRMLFVRRGVMGDRDLDLLNANLARTGAQGTDPGCAETAPLNVTYVVRAVTSGGDQLSLTAPAACLPHFHVDGQRRVTIVLDQATVDAITGPLDRFP
jgi:hypothetical protein